MAFATTLGTAILLPNVTDEPRAFRHEPFFRNEKAKSSGNRPYEIAAQYSALALATGWASVGWGMTSVSELNLFELSISGNLRAPVAMLAFLFLRLDQKDFFATVLFLLRLLLSASECRSFVSPNVQDEPRPLGSVGAGSFFIEASE